MLSRIGTITGSALALYCCKAHAKINRKIENSTPCKIVTHENFNLKLGTRDYVADITHYATLGSNRSGWAPPNRGNITRLWLFCYPVLFLDPATRSNRCTDTYAEWLKRRVSAQGRSFLGIRTMGDVMLGKYAQKNSPKSAWTGSVKTKKRKSIHRNISGTISPINNLFEDRDQTTKSTSWVVHIYPKANTTWLTAAILTIDMTSYFRSGWSDLDEIRQH